MIGADRTALVRPLLAVVTADQLWTDHLVEYHSAVLEHTMGAVRFTGTENTA